MVGGSRDGGGQLGLLFLQSDKGPPVGLPFIWSDEGPQVGQKGRKANVCALPGLLPSANAPPLSTPSKERPD